MKNITVVPAYNEEKSISETISSLYNQGTAIPEAVVVVDNGSTDNTSAVVNSLKSRYPGLHLVNEDEKGTGIACNTGFNYAIDELGADIVTRTDADTVVAKNWTEEINKRFEADDSLQLLSGPTHAKVDEFYKGYDKVIWPFLRRAHMIGMVAVSRDILMSKIAIGHNFATRATAYKRVGGFPNSHIGQLDEDVEYSKRVAKVFGHQAIEYDRQIKAFTSMRRIRRVGYLGLAGYYWDPSKPPSEERRLSMTKGEIDIR